MRNYYRVYTAYVHADHTVWQCLHVILPPDGGSGYHMVVAHSYCYELLSLRNSASDPRAADVDFVAQALSKKFSR